MNAQFRSPAVQNLLSKATATAVGSVAKVPFPNGGQAIFQAILEGTSGAVSATVALYGSNDSLCLESQTNAAKETLVTFSLSGTGNGVDGAGARSDSAVASVQAPYKYFWAEVTAISGTGAQVTLNAAY